MKLKPVLSLTLALILLLSCLVGCANSKPAASPSGQKQPSQRNEPVPAVPLSAVTNAKALGFSTFDNQLVEYLKQTGKADENFTVSPLSFKAALALSALGSEGETQAQILHALGFQSVEELRAWYATVLEGVDDFADYYGGWGGDAAYRVVNAVWANKDLPGKFQKAYLEEIAKTCRAEADSAKASELADAVNDWVNQQTNGLIPSLLEDASDSSAILVNALYLKSAWENDFSRLGDQDFTTVSGETVKKPFMHQQSHMDYYADEQTQLVVVPLRGNMSMVFVLGDDTGLAEKLSKAEYQLVDLTVPMFDVETTLNQGELVNYLRLTGCDRMFTEQAEFAPMYTETLLVGDIVQKAKVHIDEVGLEAAAVTAELLCGACEPEPETPVEFRADRPFTFYVVNGDETPELLFWGQIVK